MALATKGVFAVSAKLFVTDMDGTLLNSERKISAGNKAMIKKAVEAGVIFTIATGRMYASALPFAKDLGVEVPIITYNGAVIKTTAGKEIFTSYLDEDLINRQALHAYSLKFKQPRTKEILEFKTDIPRDMKELIEKLR